jgi:hypothetical protein
MSEELSALEESVKEVLVDLRTEKVMSERRMSTGVQASSTGGVQDSPSIYRGAETSKITTEMRTNHRDNLANAKLIPRILLAYIPPRSDTMNRDNMPRYFDYALVTAYLLKGIHTIHIDQDKIVALNFSDFNLGDHKSYRMLTPHKYLSKTKGKNSKIIPQPWTHNLVQYTLLNVMKIPYFG